jgi:DNA-binding MarR family transcriptional regulator
MARPPRTIYLLRQAQLLTYAQMVEPLKAFDLTPAQYVVLSLSRSEDGRSAADLARRSHITPQSMNEIIAVLDRKGLIQRREDPDNRRILRVTLSKDGKKLLADCDKQIDRMESEFFRCLNEKELATLRTLLAKLLRENLRKIDQTSFVDEKPVSRRAI